MVGDPEFSVGNVVQLVHRGAGHTVIWRGQQKVNESGLWVRRWVYLLDNGHWDCYHEEELHPFGRWDGGSSDSWLSAPQVPT
jgi:hypothetical protein